MQFLHAVAAYLSATHPELVWALLALAVFAICYLLRRFAPSVWERAVAIYPLSVDTSGAVVALRKVQQTWPSALIGAVLPVLLTGGDTKLALKGALVGLFAPVIHELAKALPFLPYRGETKVKPKDDDRTPPTGGKPVGLVASCFAAVTLALCLSCSAASWEQQRPVAAAVERVTTEAVQPALLRAYENEQMAAVNAATDQVDAQLRVLTVRAQWVPIFAAHDAFVAAHAAWATAIETDGDALATGIAARAAYCKLRTATKTKVALPDFPAIGCAP